MGSKTVQGKAYLGGTVQDFAYQSYNICTGDGSAWGDGVTPLECALGRQHVTTMAPVKKGLLMYTPMPLL